MVTCSLLMMRTSRSAQTQGLDNPFQAARYHSLVIRPELRYDRSSKTKAFVDSKHKSQLTFGVDAVLAF